MYDFLQYLLKVSLAISIAVFPYFLLLRKEPNLLAKRFFLIAGVILSFLFPLLPFSFFYTQASDIPLFFMDIVPPQLFKEKLREEEVHVMKEFPFYYVVLIFYSSGCILFIVRGLNSFITWRKVKKNALHQVEKIIYSDRNEVFAFFNYIHLPYRLKSSSGLNYMILHEKAHIRQAHYIDLLIAQIALIINWFNPFIWLSLRMIKENHEHLADREVLSHGTNPLYYKAQLLNQTLGISLFGMGQAFNQSLTKKRFNMMGKRKISRKGKIKFLIISSLVFISINFLGVSDYPVKDIVEGNIIFSETHRPASGVSIVIKDEHTGTLSDERGNFAISMKGEAEIIFSCVGYQNEQITVQRGDKINLSLSKKIYEMDIEYAPAEDKLNEQKIKKSLEKPYPDRANAEIYNNQTFSIVEELPSFPGGQRGLQSYIYSNLTYPMVAENNEKEGKVVIKFTITREGVPVSFEILESSDPVFNEAAINIFRTMPSWNPGIQAGKPVDVTVAVPVYFRI